MKLAIITLVLVGSAFSMPYGGHVNTGHSAQYRHDDVILLVVLWFLFIFQSSNIFLWPAFSWPNRDMVATNLVIMKTMLPVAPFARKKADQAIKKVHTVYVIVMVVWGLFITLLIIMVQFWIFKFKNIKFKLKNICFNFKDSELRYLRMKKGWMSSKILPLPHLIQYIMVTITEVI